jgi:hypothetical protein
MNFLLIFETAPFYCKHPVFSVVSQKQSASSLQQPLVKVAQENNRWLLLASYGKHK